MRARGIPGGLLRWIEAFCSERTATIQVNGQSSKVQSLPQSAMTDERKGAISGCLFRGLDDHLVEQREIENRGRWWGRVSTKNLACMGHVCR
ncbi:hypothetical protein F5883DRAFT_593778 [Diaporthe sp. PMI_573]|nr:hypothetical protein F5883DRAFT_593778 [Diaporthaceae sp. PMI_573]